MNCGTKIAQPVKKSKSGNEPFLNQSLQTFKSIIMNTHKSLVIANPCHANWNKMTPTEKGRLCASCQKEVVDFRSKSKEEVITYLENYQGEGQTCGQFSASQIDKVGKNYINSTILKRLSISFMAFLGFLSFKEAKSQKVGKVAIKGDISYEEFNMQNQKKEITLFGTVRNSAGEKIAGAEIKFSADGKQLAVTRTISNGSFAIKVTTDKSMKAIMMYTSANGYERKINVIPDLQKDRIKIDIVMDWEMMILGEIAIDVDTVQPDEPEKISNLHDSTETCIKIIENGTNIEKIPEQNDDSDNDSTQNNLRIDLIEDKNKLRVYPNPSYDNAIIEWKELSEFENREILLEVHDINGKLIWTTKLKGSKTIFNTTNLANGNYLVKITDTTTGKSETAQLTVVH